MIAKCFAVVSGLSLLPGMACVSVGWLSNSPEWRSIESWVAVGVVILPYLLLVPAIWRFRREWRSSLALLVTTVPGAAFFAWALWPISPDAHSDEIIAAGAVAGLAYLLQLLLATTGFMWAAIVSSAE